MSQVECGYGYCISEYDNDQSVRLEIEEVLANVPFGDGDGFVDEVRQLDAKFLKVTRDRKRPVDDLPIMNRIPLRLEGNLKEDVEALDL